MPFFKNGTYVVLDVNRRFLLKSGKSNLPKWHLRGFGKTIVDVRQKVRNCLFGKLHLPDFRRNLRLSSKTTYVPFLKNGTYEVLEENRRNAPFSTIKL